MAHTLSEHQLRRRARDETEQPLEFAVEAWTRDRASLEQVLSRSNNLLIARAAYHQACKLHPTLHLTLRHGCHLIEEQRASK